MDLDPIDERLVHALMSDGRASYAQLGAIVNLSAPAVKRRVDRLRAANVITGFTVRVDPDSLGWTTEAYVEIFCSRRVSGAEIRAQLLPYPDVVEAVAITGHADALVHVYAAVTAHLERVQSAISAEPFVARTRSAIVLSPLVRRQQTPTPEGGVTPGDEAGTVA
jgi:DNA-binding Lrp family transcriptional regulator